MSKIDKSKRRKVARMLEQGHSFAEIARAVGVTRQRILQLSREMGYSVRRVITLSTIR